MSLYILFEYLALMITFPIAFQLKKGYEYHTYNLRRFVVVYNKCVVGDVGVVIGCDDVGSMFVSFDVVCIAVSVEVGDVMIGVVLVQFPNFVINFSSVFSASSIFRSRDVSTVR